MIINNKKLRLQSNTVFLMIEFLEKFRQPEEDACMIKNYCDRIELNKMQFFFRLTDLKCFKAIMTSHHDKQLIPQAVYITKKLYRSV